MKNWQSYFKGKKITIMGLGLLGRGLGYTKFLAESGAVLTVTDLKSKEQLSRSLKALSKYKNIKFVLGEHRLEDFKDKDMIIKSAGVPLDSIYIKEAKKNRIPIEMDVSLFVKIAPKMKIIGVTGTRGKSMTTMIIHHILKENEKFLGVKVYLGGNVRGIATLPLVKKVKENDILVCELDSWQLQGFGDSKISPNISVFTTFMPDHMNYYKGDVKKYFDDKSNIFKYQKKEDVLIIRPGMKKLIPSNFKSKLLIAKPNSVSDYDFVVLGSHQRENMSAAVEVARELGISERDIKKAVKSFKGVEGRFQYVKSVKGVSIYNDNNSTTPEATVAGIESLKESIVLIAGGADKNLDLKNLVGVINQKCKSIVLLPGTGTTRLLKDFEIKIPVYQAKDLKDAVSLGMKSAKRGNTLLFSPAFTSFGMFVNEYDRNDKFMKIIKNLK
jgi:UDP-N-acetylmuramoylalanine--D-glutamate ligase